jgi:hypothetical protein
MANQLSAIKHIVRLMLENRFFDQMLGFLYESNGNKSPTNQPFEGLTGNESNPDDAGREVKVFKIDPNATHCYLMPGAYPGEGFQNTSSAARRAAHSRGSSAAVRLSPGRYCARVDRRFCPDETIGPGVIGISVPGAAAKA